MGLSCDLPALKHESISRHKTRERVHHFTKSKSGRSSSFSTSTATGLPSSGCGSY